MTASSARARAGWLLYAAAQFVVLTTIAMHVYADEHRFFHYFLSELGATRAWSGRPNHAAMVLFSTALAGVGFALVAFAGTWRAIAFQRERARGAGIAAQVLGTFAGAAFVAIACTPVDVALAMHNALVVAAFGLLLGYAIAMTILWASNDAPRLLVAISVLYVLLVVGYAIASAIALQRGIATLRGRELLVVSQKIVVYASMLYVAYVTIASRRQLARAQITAALVPRRGSGPP